MPKSDVSYIRFISPLSCDCTNDEVIKIIMCLHNTGAGHDRIPMVIYKNYLNAISKIITYICNMSLLQGIFPSDLVAK